MNEQPPLTNSQALLKILGTLEIFFALLLSCIWLYIVGGFIFGRFYGLGEIFGLAALIILTPILAILWTVGIIALRCKNTQVAWCWQIAVLALIVIGLFSPALTSL